MLNNYKKNIIASIILALLIICLCILLVLNAKNLLEKQNQQKELQKLSLGQAGTTKEKAAESQIISNLADLALE